MTVAEMLEEFHGVFAPATPGPLRARLVREESLEAQEAILSGDRAHIAKELADLVYVAYGAALAYGIDLDVALGEVHRSNMSKLGSDGLPVLRGDGKVLKGPGFVEADVTAALAQEDHRG